MLPFQNLTPEKGFIWTNRKDCVSSGGWGWRGGPEGCRKRRDVTHPSPASPWTPDQNPGPGPDKPSRLLKLLQRPSDSTPGVHNHPVATAVTPLIYVLTRQIIFFPDILSKKTKESASSTAGRLKAQGGTAASMLLQGRFRQLQMFFSGRGQCEEWRDEMERLW